MFDFHSLTLVVPSLLWAIYLVDSGSRWRYWGILALILCTREDMALLACFIGAYAIVQRRHLTGLATILISVAYLALIKAFVMNDPGLLMSGGQESTSFIYFYEDMIPHREEGIRGLVITFLTNPVFVLKVLFIEKKIFFFLTLLLPLLFLPLFAGRKVIMMLYGFVFIGLASRPHVFSLHFQYSSTLFPILLAAIPDAVARASHSRLAAAFGLSSTRLVWTLVWTMVASQLLVTHKYGVFWPNDSFKAGWNRLSRNFDEEKRERYLFLRELVSHIPADASVSATSNLGPHVSNRQEIAKWPRVDDADYLLLHEEGLRDKSQRRVDRLVKTAKYRKVSSAHGLALYERVPQSEREERRRTERKLDRTRKPVEQG